MYNEYWGFRRSPFAGDINPDRFYESPGHEEALARLAYVVEQCRLGGLMVGPPGVGKSIALEVFARRLRRPDRELVLLRCPAFGMRELFFELATQMRLAPEPDEPAAELWRRLREHVAANHADGVQTVILIDQAHLLCEQPEQQRALHLLYQLAAYANSRLTVLLSGRPELLSRAAADVVEWVDLGVMLEPLDEAETAHYVEHMTRWAGRDRPAFSPEALRHVYRLSGGVPRRINRVCDLALLAACSEEQELVSAEVVETVYRDLIPAGSIPQPATADT